MYPHFHHLRLEKGTQGGFQVIVQRGKESGATTRPYKLDPSRPDSANHFVSSFHQIERFNQTFIRKSTSSLFLDQAESDTHPAA